MRILRPIICIGVRCVNYIFGVDTRNKIVYVFRTYMPIRGNLEYYHTIDVSETIDEVQEYLTGLEDIFRNKVPLEEFTFEEVKMLYDIAVSLMKLYREKSVSREGDIYTKILVAGFLNMMFSNNIRRTILVWEDELKDKIGEYINKDYVVITVWDGKIMGV